MRSFHRKVRRCAECPFASIPSNPGWWYGSCSLVPPGGVGGIFTKNTAEAIPSWCPLLRATRTVSIHPDAEVDT